LLALRAVTFWETTMSRDPARIASLQDALRTAELDALVCSLPANVLLASGYWPVVGTSLAVVARDGPVAILAPQDERELAEEGGADEVRTFQPGSLDTIESTAVAVSGPLAKLAGDLGLGGKRLGYEGQGGYEASSYAAMYLYGAGLPGLLQACFERPRLTPADDLLARLRARKTPQEAERIRTACAIVGEALLQGSRALREGMTETEAAARFRAPLSIDDTGEEGVERAGGFAFCMSGPNAAKAHGAYARSRSRRLTAGELVLVHCNSCADGYWTDVTRTYRLDRSDERLYDAVFAAWGAALAEIKVGVKASAVDGAAREVLGARGLGREFKHSTGQGVSFAAINHNALPRLHPKSDDVLEAGMVFNVEPAVYLDGHGGLRHCDVVALTANGPEVLTPFQGSTEELILL
jgi:Xaa-Pro aminopeptidase